MSSIEAPHERAFGVEIECGFPSGWRGAQDLIYSTFGNVDDYSDDGSSWSVGEDGTDVEIRTPILQGERGFDMLKRAMTVIREAGGYVTPSDGMHVHHDAPDFAENPRLCLPLVESWRRNLDAIQSMVMPRRRNSYGACPEWSDRAYEILRRWVEGQDTYLRIGRNDLNLAALAKTRPSIEIRLHEGTLDGDVACAWVQFGQKFLFDVVKLNGKRLRKRESDELLLDRIKLSPEATAILLAKKQQNFQTPLMMFEQRRKPRSDYDETYYDDDYCCDCCEGTCGPDCCGEDY